MYFNFELILFYATVVTGLVALFDIVFLAKKRKNAKKEMSMVVDYSRSFFPVLLIVFILRSFLFEPFRIPSGSLEPTLLVGDFILVNKFDYGVRIPVIHKKVVAYNEPKRGDIMVFRWPPNQGYDFIKRVIGLPGDTVSYINKQLYINNVKVPLTNLEKKMVADEVGDETLMQEKIENLPGMTHDIYVNPKRESANYFNLVVPAGMYFVMGDNRDDSADSRFWGFVPEKNIVGKAVLVWMSWDGQSNRIRWERLGHIINSTSKI